MISLHRPLRSRGAGGPHRSPQHPPWGIAAVYDAASMSEPTEAPSEADLLFAYVRRRYAERLTAEELEALRRSVDEVMRLSAALRAVKLGNAEEPFQRFEAFRDDA